MSARLPQPTIELVREYGSRFDKEQSIASIEQALSKLVASFPHNEVVSEVLLKVTAINSLYSTNIYALVAIAEHIARRNLDALIASGDSAAVDLIATVQIEGKARRNYSFASKYCSWHNQASFPIYDSRARNNLWKYKRQDRFFDFSSNDLWCYNGYRRYFRIVEAFRTYYGLSELNFKEIDKFLYLFSPEAESESGGSRAFL